jgi:threonyl-tRNA synthetase
VWKNSSAYWLGKAENDSLQRVYGISFPSEKLLKEWKHFQVPPNSLPLLPTPTTLT